MSAAGFDSKQWQWHLASFVRFGSSDAAKKFTGGDQFDRAEIKNAANDHQKVLRQCRFVVKNLTLSVEKRDDVETKGLFTLLKLPLRVRGPKPFNEDRSEIARRVGVSVPTIYHWKRRLGVEGTTTTHEESGPMVRVIAADWPTATVAALPGTPWTISLVFASGLVCRIEPDFDERTLLRLVNLLTANHG